MLTRRKSRGSIIADYAAALVVLITAITFPLINFATSTYRYSMVVAAAHAVAHKASSATSCNDTTDATSIKNLVTNGTTSFLGNADGIKVLSSTYRLKSSTVATTPTTTVGAWGAKLGAAADSSMLYSVEVLITAQVSPLVNVSFFGLVPVVPGLTGPATYSLSGQELVEFPNGLNK